MRNVLVITEPDNVQSAVLEILKRIRPDVADVKGRLDRLELLVRKQGRDSAAMHVMMRALRLTVIEEDVRLLMELDELSAQPLQHSVTAASRGGEQLAAPAFPSSLLVKLADVG